MAVSAAVPSRLASRCQVRALVTSIDDARAALNCSVCDESEGVYLGDVTNASTLLPAARGVDTVAIAVGVSGDVPEDVQKAVEFGGVQNTVAALAQPANQAGGTTARLRVVLCSSMGTTDPDPSPMEGGSVLFWKLNAEGGTRAEAIRGLHALPRTRNRLLSTPRLLPTRSCVCVRFS